MPTNDGQEAFRHASCDLITIRSLIPTRCARANAPKSQLPLVAWLRLQPSTAVLWFRFCTLSLLLCDNDLLCWCGSSTALCQLKQRLDGGLSSGAFSSVHLGVQPKVPHLALIASGRLHWPRRLYYCEQREIQSISEGGVPSRLNKRPIRCAQG